MVNCLATRPKVMSLRCVFWCWLALLVAEGSIALVMASSINRVRECVAWPLEANGVQ